MPPFLIAARKDLLRRLRDPVALLFWLAIPLLTGVLMTQSLGGKSGPAPKLHLLVADEDDSFGSRLLLGALAQGRATEFIQTESVDQTAGRNRLEHGQGTALLIIPKGFAQALLRERPTRLTLLTNPSQRFLPGIAEELLRSAADAVFYLHRLAGPEFHEPAQGSSGPRRALGAADFARAGASIGQAVESLGTCLFPPAITLVTETTAAPQASNPAKIPLTTALFPGIVLMSLLFTSQGLSADLWRERDAGLLRRVLTTHLSMPAFLSGKLAAAAAVLSAVSLVMLMAGMLYLSLPLARLPLAWAWSAGTGLLLTLLMLCIQMHASSRRAASFLTFSLVFPLFMAGGSFFPSEIMPAWMAALGRWTPNGWATEQLKGLLLARPGPLPLAGAFALLALLSGVLFAWNTTRLARVFARK